MKRFRLSFFERIVKFWNVTSNFASVVVKCKHMNGYQEREKNMHWKKAMRKIFAMMMALCIMLTQNQMLVSADEIPEEQSVEQENVSDRNGVISPCLTDDAEWITDEEYDGEASLYGVALHSLHLSGL